MIVSRAWSNLKLLLDRLWRSSRLAVIFLILGILTNLLALYFSLDPARPTWPVLLAWLFSLTVLLIGARLWLTARPADPELAWLPWEGLALLGLTVLALALRLPGLEALPANIHGDEGAMGLEARSVLRGSLANPFITGWLDHPTLWFFIQALSLRLAGDSIGGLRALSAVLGTAAIPALYLFTRPVWGRGNAFLAAGLLAVYHFHIHFSRIGLNNIGDPLLGLTAFAVFFHGYRTRSVFSWMLSGILLGLGQYFYFGARLLPLLLLGVLFHQLILDRQRLWSVRWHLVLLALGFFAAFAPLLSYFIRFPVYYTGRLVGHGLFQSGRFAALLAEGQSIFQILAYQFQRGFGAFTIYQDSSQFYAPEMPLLDPFSAGLLYIGLGVAAWNWRKPEAALLLLWVVGAALFGGVLLVDPPQSPRYITTAPALCLLIVLALDWVAAPLRQFPRLGPHRLWIAATVVVLLGWWNVNFYFFNYTPRNSYGMAARVTSLAYYLQDQAQDRYVYFAGAPHIYLDHPTLRFIGGPLSGEDILNPMVGPGDVPALPVEKKGVFLFLPEREQELAIVQAAYPGGIQEIVAKSPGSDSVYFFVYRLP